MSKIVAKNNSHFTKCLRNGEWVELMSSDLVPGDTISLDTENPVIPADCIGLVAGKILVISYEDLTFFHFFTKN